MIADDLDAGAWQLMITDDLCCPLCAAIAAAAAPEPRVVCHSQRVAGLAKIIMCKQRTTPTLPIDSLNATLLMSLCDGPLQTSDAADSLRPIGAPFPPSQPPFSRAAGCHRVTLHLPPPSSTHDAAAFAAA